VQLDSEEQRIFDAVSDSLDIEAARLGLKRRPIDLGAAYTTLRSKYFGGRIPELSENFVRVFQKLPLDAAGATFVGERAKRPGVKAGIRINDKLRDFPSEVHVILLHEMIHVAGIEGHGDELKAEISKLWVQRAYLDPLIL
jgi:hypothetical protein